MSTDIATWKNEIKEKTFKREAKMGRIYIKQRRLGSGAFGEGWLCTDRLHKRNVVVKIAHGPMTSEKEEYNAKKEVAVMEKLKHPNIVSFYEAWVETDVNKEERLHIAMEYCDAGDIGNFINKRLRDDGNKRKIQMISDIVRQQCEPHLKGWSPETLVNDKEAFTKIHAKCTSIAERVYSDVIEREGRLHAWSLPELESWMVQLLWGIWYIHKKRVVHRDIKPDNIFLAGGGKIIKIGDFGISGLQAHTNAPMQTRAGTPLFMAPEMWKSGGSYTDRCDVYALGVMFFELGSLQRCYDARLPFTASWGGVWGTQHMRFLKEQIMTPNVRPMDLPQKQLESSFFEMIKTMLRKDPRVRPTAGQLLRSVRLQVVSRRVIEVFKKAGESPDAEDPHANNSDFRHKNTHNPANNQFTLHDTARFQCSSPDSEVLMLNVNNKISIRPDPSFDQDAIGHLTFGDIIEVSSRRVVDDVEWVQSEAGWCITQHEGKSLMTSCPEDLLSRDPSDIEVLGLAYGAVVKDVQSILKEALKVKLEKQKGTTVKNTGTPAPSKKRTPTPVREKAVTRHRSPVHVPAAPARKLSPSPRRNSLLHTPTKPARRGDSPVSIRRNSTSPLRRASPTKRAGGGGEAPRVSPRPRNSPARMRPEAAHKEYKEKVVAIVGKEAAKQLFHDYIQVHKSYVKKGFMHPGGSCQELKAYENVLKTYAIFFFFFENLVRVVA